MCTFNSNVFGDATGKKTRRYEITVNVNHDCTHVSAVLVPQEMIASVQANVLRQLVFTTETLGLGLGQSRSSLELEPKAWGLGARNIHRQPASLSTSATVA